LTVSSLRKGQGDRNSEMQSQNRFHASFHDELHTEDQTLRRCRLLGNRLEKKLEIGGAKSTINPPSVEEKSMKLTANLFLRPEKKTQPTLRRL